MQRIVTGKGPDGSPAILFEGEPPTVVDFGKYVTTELWVNRLGAAGDRRRR